MFSVLCCDYLYPVLLLDGYLFLISLQACWKRSRVLPSKHAEYPSHYPTIYATARRARRYLNINNQTLSYYTHFVYIFQNIQSHRLKYMFQNLTKYSHLRLLRIYSIENTDENWLTHFARLEFCLLICDIFPEQYL
jgi:hypothetical protein